jgi:hypothetical protein
VREVGALEKLFSSPRRRIVRLALDQGDNPVEFRIRMFLKIRRTVLKKHREGECRHHEQNQTENPT